MVHYKLTYFDIRGRAEPIRQIFAVAEVPFDDVRIAREEWPALKAKTIFGQIPMLEVDGKQLAQSTTIMRFLARTFGLAGKTPLEEAQVDMIADQVTDCMNEVRPYFSVVAGFVPGDKDKLYKDVFLPAREKHFALFKKFIGDGDKFLVGDSITWADIFFAEVISNLKGFAPQSLDGYPEIERYIAKIHSNPKIKKHLETRPVRPV